VERFVSTAGTLLDKRSLVALGMDTSKCYLPEKASEVSANVSAYECLLLSQCRCLVKL
jgi:hypothetical protein